MDPWIARNNRRNQLVVKKYAGGLSSDESRELDRIKREIYEHAQTFHPRPGDVLDRIDARIDAIMNRLKGRGGPKP